MLKAREATAGGLPVLKPKVPLNAKVETAHHEASKAKKAKKAFELQTPHTAHHQHNAPPLFVALPLVSPHAPPLHTSPCRHCPPLFSLAKQSRPAEAIARRDHRFSA